MKMSDISISISLPLDDEKFFRRECPFCKKEFKIQIEKKDLIDLAQKGIDSFLTDDEVDSSEYNENDDIINYYFCPYCGQQAPDTHWWTQEQLKYINIFAENIMARLINENLIKPLKRNLNKSSKFLSISFKGKEMEYKEPWISDEINDMKIFNLPCCNKKIKIEEDWDKNVYCFYCGFEHKQNKGDV